MLRLGDIVGNYMHRLWLSYSSIRADASAATLSMPALRAPCMVFFIVTSDREPGSGGLAMQCVRIRHQMDCPEKDIGFLVLDAYTSVRFDFSDESLDAFTDEVINNRIVGAMYTFRPNYEASMNSITTSTAWLSCEMHKRQTAIYCNMFRACTSASLT
jgi:hypothetical protein